jgi:uncharacterized iron-regulated protein
MNSLSRALILTSLLLFVPLIAAAHIVNLNTNQEVTLVEIIPDLSGSQAVFIGETHDQMSHHEAQLQIIHELHASGAEISIGLEMFRRDGQHHLDEWVEGRIEESTFSRIFEEHWSNWEMYRDIFIYARDQKIPIVGLNISRKIVSKVARSGFASLSSTDREKLPLSTCNVSREYRQFIRRTLQGHPLEGTAFENFCEAQILWDASMAEQLDEVLRDQPNRTVVVLAGNGHAWKHGIVEQLARFGDYNYRVLLPEIPGRIDLQHSSDDEADYLLQGVDYGPLH